MAQVALFHPSFGVIAGVKDAAEKLRNAGHEVVVVDQYDGLTFDTYESASEYVQSIGFPALMQKAVDAVASLRDGFVAMGFSNGGGMATHVALQRKVAGVINVSGAGPLEMFGGNTWPAEVPLQLHHTIEDPRAIKGAVESLMGSVSAANASTTHIQYPGNGHLFTFADLADEYDEQSADYFWRQTLWFIDDCSNKNNT